MKSKNVQKILIGCLASGIIAALLMLFVAIYLKCAPFGNNSFAGGDINISQLDEYGYLKDILDGKNSFGYTFSMGLGGDTANVFGYGMASPLNFLVYFFKKSDFHLFFTIMVILKIGLIASAMSYFLQEHFKGKLSLFFLILLSVSFALSQYSVYQIQNIFWLDGVMMLPLILAGIDKVIEKGSPYLFTFSIALSLLFNWYSGVINCIFSIFWFLFIYAHDSCVERKYKSFRSFLKSVLKCLFGGITGVLLSCALLIPVFSAIKKGNRGDLNLELFTNTLRDNPLTIFTQSIIGTNSTSVITTIFCGSFACIGLFSYFLSKKYSVKDKLIHISFLIVIVLSFYWQPLNMLFSMMKYVSSFWCRYSYIGIISVVFIAAEYYSSDISEEKALPLISAVIYSIILGVLIIYFKKTDLHFVIPTLLMIDATSLFLSCWNLSLKKWLKNGFSFVLCAGVLFELFFNAKVIGNGFITGNVDQYQSYVSKEENLIDRLQKDDAESYRISENKTRLMYPGNLTSEYNEPLAYHYWGISSYTNSPNELQRIFLDHLGYRINGENFYIVNTSVLPADSLLGIKYFLSDNLINGYKKIGYKSTNGKYVYENPYALPMTFTVKSLGRKTAYTNPFEFQNDVYKELTNTEQNLFKKCQVEKQVDGKTVTYMISPPIGNYSLYGNILWGSSMNATLLNDKDAVITSYSRWGSPSVFYIPFSNKSDSVTIKLQCDEKKELSIMDEQFYALDLNALKNLTDEIKENNQVLNSSISNGHAVIKVDADTSLQLMTSIPYDEGWTVTDNGKKINAEKFENCLMTFKLSPGEHEIIMNYNLPGFKEGIIGSCLGLLLLALYFWIDKKGKFRVTNHE